MRKIIAGIGVAIVAIIIISAIFGGGLVQTILGLGLGGATMFLGG
jgi:hypothetical protein